MMPNFCLGGFAYFENSVGGAAEKKLATCSDCDSFPCEKYDKGIFAESFIKWIRDKLKEP